MKTINFQIDLENHGFNWDMTADEVQDRFTENEGQDQDEFLTGLEIIDLCSNMEFTVADDVDAAAFEIEYRAGIVAMFGESK